MMAMATADDAGYNGDDNEDYDPSSLLMAGDHRGDQQRQPQPKQRHEVVDPLTLPSGDITHHIYRWQGKNDQSANDNASNSGNYLTFAANTLSLQQQQQQQQQQPANFNSPSIASNNYRDSPAMSIGGGGRRRSFSGWDSDSEWDIGYTRRQINAPGGFRRQFVRERAVRQGRQYPAFIADSFVDFIALYGHFAGGNYLSDEDEEYFEHVQQQQQQQYEEAGDSGQLIPASASSGRGGDQGDGGDVPADERTPLRRTTSSLHATASNRKAFFLVIKAFIGTGVLVLPRAFYNGGLLTSCVLMVAVA
ncbi:vacuolar amino acid transporter 4, partial [Dipsacomyces acuminosporus]